MRKILLLIIISLSVTISAQKGITFEVEDLSKPKNLLQMRSSEEIYKNLILSDVKLSPINIEKNKIEIPYGIVAMSEDRDKLVNFGYNSFFNGMYQAYADHRPFVLSPDMIWLLISQGFTRHINANPEEMRKYFVDYSGKQTLIVKTSKVKLDDPNSPWHEIFPQFTEQINKEVGQGLVDLLSCNFSTTTSVEKIASEITIMDAMKPYFEFVILYIGCGIPQITLEGTPEDWQKVLNKTKQLEKYELGWWTKQLYPILQEFVIASQGDIDKDFWRNMFKYHTQEIYGAPNIDGWIVKFFPYDKDGNRNNLKELQGGNNLPDEIVKVDVKYIDTEKEIETPLEFWAGFIGLEQEEANFALRPRIGWMIRKKDVDDLALKEKLKKEALSGWFSIRVKDFPSALLALDSIKTLNIEFIDKINIPDKLKDVKIGSLSLFGEIDDATIKRIEKLLANTEVTINGFSFDDDYNGVDPRTLMKKAGKKDDKK